MEEVAGSSALPLFAVLLHTSDSSLPYLHSYYWKICVIGTSVSSLRDGKRMGMGSDYLAFTPGICASSSSPRHDEPLSPRPWIQIMASFAAIFVRGVCLGTPNILVSWRSKEATQRCLRACSSNTMLKAAITVAICGTAAAVAPAASSTAFASSLPLASSGRSAVCARRTRGALSTRSMAEVAPASHLGFLAVAFSLRG